MVKVPQKHIMVAEDEADNRIILKTYFESEGYRVTLTENGKQCLEAIAANPKDLPDCLLLDVMMPELNGAQVAQKIKGHPKTKFIPIIMITALTDRKYSRAALVDLKVEYFMTKPFDIEELHDKVKTAIKYKVVEEIAE